MSHPYVVIFHFPRDSPLTSADVEDEIAAALGNERGNRNAEHVIDGNEIGDAIDIFVSSRDPNAVFAMCRSMLQQQGLLETAVVAYGPDWTGPFTIIHPADFKGQFHL